MGVKWISLEGSEGYTVVLPADLMSLLAEAGNFPRRVKRLTKLFRH